jgi:hypothetical protein
MLRHFDENRTNAKSARQVYLILIGCASRRETLTYKQLGLKMGFKSPNGAAGTLGPIVGHLLFWCKEEGLPHINTLVVNAETGVPGDGPGYDAKEVPAFQQEVFGFDWYSIDVPKLNELDEAYRAGVVK